MRCNWLICGALSGAAMVLLGAFGAHALRERLEPGELELWRTAVQYQGFHALALGLVGLLERAGLRSAAAGPCFAGGTLLFSGSLYALALGAPRAIGAITPVGGAGFVAGWLLLALAARTHPPGGRERAI